MFWHAYEKFFGQIVSNSIVFFIRFLGREQETLRINFWMSIFHTSANPFCFNQILSNLLYAHLSNINYYSFCNKDSAKIQIKSRKTWITTRKCNYMKEISVFFLVFYRKIIKFAQYAIEMDVSFIIKWRIFRLFYIITVR